MLVPVLLISVDWSNPFHYLRRKSLYVLQYHLYKRSNQFHKMPFFASYDVLDSLPDRSELLREMFEPVDDDQHRDVLEELDEFGEDVLYVWFSLWWGLGSFSIILPGLVCWIFLPGLPSDS